MDVQSLRLQIRDADCNAMLKRLLPADAPLEDLLVQIHPDGVCVKGAYPLLVRVGFESWWKLDVQHGKLSANLTRLKAFGMPAFVFKSAVLKVLREISAKQLWLDVRGDDVLLDVEGLLARELCPTRVTMTRVTSGDGVLVLEAGP